MSTIGANLRIERIRLGLNQEEFAEVGGVKKRAQISYEQDERCPDANYLAALAAVGVDVQFVLTNTHSSAAMSADESELIEGYRSLDIRGKAGVLGMISGMVTPQTIGGATNHGKVGQQFIGDITGSKTVNLIGKKTKK